MPAAATLVTPSPCEEQHSDIRRIQGEVLAKLLDTFRPEVTRVKRIYFLAPHRVTKVTKSRVMAHPRQVRS